MSRHEEALKSRAIREFREKRDSAVCRMAAEGARRSQICAALGCDPRAVNRILAKYGQNRSRVRTAPNEAETRVMNLYRAGLSLREVGRHVQLSMQRAHQIMRRWAPQDLRAPASGMKLTPERRLVEQARRLPWAERKLRAVG